MRDEYRLALDRAQRELAECDAEANHLERKRAKLRQTIAVLQSLLGSETQAEQSVTDAILTITKAADGFISSAEVVERLETMGLSVQGTTVATLLSRLTKAGQLLNGVGADGSGYMWNGPSGSRMSAAMENIDVVQRMPSRKFRKMPD